MSIAAIRSARAITASDSHTPAAPQLQQHRPRIVELPLPVSLDDHAQSPDDIEIVGQRSSPTVQVVDDCPRASLMQSRCDHGGFALSYLPRND